MPVRPASSARCPSQRTTGVGKKRNSPILCHPGRKMLCGCDCHPSHAVMPIHLPSSATPSTPSRLLDRGSDLAVCMDRPDPVLQISIFPCHCRFILNLSFVTVTGKRISAFPSCHKNIKESLRRGIDFMTVGSAQIPVPEQKACRALPSQTLRNKERAWI